MNKISDFRLYILHLVVTFILLFSLQGYSGEGGAPLTGEVLLINSYHQGFSWTDSITKSVADYFKNKNDDVNLRVEFMDTKNFSIDLMFPELYEIFKAKYSIHKPDVIICSDNNALTFIVKYRQSLFPGVPVVFCGVNNFSMSMLKGQKNITGVVEDISEVETIDLALDMKPQAKRLYALACSAETSKEHIKRFRESSKEFSDRIDIVILHDLEKDEFAAELAQISKDDILLNFGFHYTRDQFIPSLSQAYDFFRKYTEAPVYTFWAQYADFATGGVMIDGRAQGKMAAELAREILLGTPAEDLAIVDHSPNVVVLNYQDLQAIGMVDAISLVSEDAHIINRPFSFYDNYKWLVWGVSFVLAGMITLIFLLSISNRQRRKAEQELLLKQHVLHDQKENLRVILASIGEGVIATDTEGVIQQVNPVAESLLGCAASEAAGRPLTEVFRIVDNVTREAVDNPVREVISSGRVISQNGEVLLISRDENEYPIADSAAPIKNDNAETIGAVLVFRDVTEENSLQMQLRQSQKMDAIGQLAGGVAHDFNNMLGGVVASADLAKSNLEKGKDPLKYIDIIIDAAERATSLTGKLLAFSRQQQKASTPIDTNEILKDTIDLFCSTVDKRISIRQSLNEKQLLVIGDPSLLQSAFMNLMINASHAMPEGGELFVSSTQAILTADYCAASSFEILPGDYIEIEIRDTGEGISKHDLERIFDPFFTTKKTGKGTGLGLAAVLGTVQQHKGAVVVESREGVGTSFHILLPLTKKELPVQQTEARQAFKGEGTILVVDDEEIMRITAKAILEDQGRKVILAENGREACELYKKKKECVDLVILDMIMPEMNGRDCFMEIRKMNPEAKIIISSGFSQPEEVQELRGAGLAGFIHKPFRGNDLGEAISEVL